MKNRISIVCLLVTMILISCTPVATAIPSKSLPAPTSESIIPTVTISAVPSQVLRTYDGRVIEPYLDVRSQNLTNLGRSLDESLIQTLWFNESTIWSQPDREIAQNILQLGMNPGLGVRDLHAEGITGKGVNVAIIDQFLLLDHPEFSDKVVKYYDVGIEPPADRGSMHGPAVTSLLVGQNIGTAPDARVYYAAVPAWALDAKYYADALNWIIEENEKLADENKIRVVSVSAAPSGEGSVVTKNNDMWDVAYQRAMESDILVIDCTKQHRITAPCSLDLHDPDEPAKCIPGWPQNGNYNSEEGVIYIPTPRRTTAEEYRKGQFSYQYHGPGGLSWSVPYLAGVLALGWQINPNLTGSQLLDMIYASAYETDTHIKIINPKAFIERVKLTVNQ